MPETATAVSSDTDAVIVKKSGEDIATANATLNPSRTRRRKAVINVIRRSLLFVFFPSSSSSTLVQNIPTIALKTLHTKTSSARTALACTKTNTAETIATTATCSLMCKKVSNTPLLSCSTMTMMSAC
jgi:hypothetical protein